MLSNEKRICEYFVISGFGKTRQPYDLSQIYYQGEEICNANVELAKDFFHYKEPIVDIRIISTSSREKVPDGFHIVDRTYSKLNKADLNGKASVDELYMCFRYGRDQPPITDIWAFNPKQKNVVNQEGWILVDKTTSGHSANLHSGSSNPLYIAYRRAPANAPVDNLVVTDICVILTNKNEFCPPAYSRVDVAIKRTALSHTINICYKKSIVKQHVLTYQPEVIYCLPSTSNEPVVDLYHPDPECVRTSQCLPDDIRDVANFCMPWGATLESWSTDLRTPRPSFVTFVLTNMTYDRMYGAAMLFFEPLSATELTPEESLSLLGPGGPSPSRALFASKSICLLSRWPLFQSFSRVLSFLIAEDERQRQSAVGCLPLERFISQLLHAVPFPTPAAPNLLLQWGQGLETAIGIQLPTDALSRSRAAGENFYQLARGLEVDEIVQLFLLVVTEQKILLTSTCHSELTGIAEALIACIFPFKWSVVYIPFLYLGCIHIIQSPAPYLIGVDSRFFDYFRLPDGVGCLDLINRSIKPPLLPDQTRVPPLQLPRAVLRSLKTGLANCKARISSYEKQQGLRRMTGSSIDEFSVLRRKESIGDGVRECFLRAMTLMFKDYQRFLVPASARHRDDDMFDMDGFLKSVDRGSRPLYQAIFDTQLWNHFIMERSYATEVDDSLAFFDRCCRLVQTMGEEQASVSSLLQTDSVVRSEHTKVVPPPDPVDGWVAVAMVTFPRRLDQRLLLSPSTVATPEQTVDASPDPSSLPTLLLRSADLSSTPGKASVLRRPFEELKQARHLAGEARRGPAHAWAGHLLASHYCLWYLSLPGLLGYVLDTAGLAESGLAGRILQLAVEMLGAICHFRLILPDEVCCRVLLLLVHQLRPARLKIGDVQRQAEMNAFSYGLCNQILLEEETQLQQSQEGQQGQRDSKEERDADSGRETLASDNNMSTGPGAVPVAKCGDQEGPPPPQKTQTDHCLIEIGGKTVRLRGRHQRPRKPADRMSQMLFSFPAEMCALEADLVRGHQFLDQSAGIIMSSAPRKLPVTTATVPDLLPPILALHKSPPRKKLDGVLLRCPFAEEKSDLHASFLPKKRDTLSEADDEQDDNDDDDSDKQDGPGATTSAATVASVIRSLREWHQQSPQRQGEVEPVLRCSDNSLAHSDLGPPGISNKTRASFRQLKTAANKSLRSMKSMMSSMGSGSWLGGGQAGLPSTFRPWEPRPDGPRLKTTASAELLDTEDRGEDSLRPWVSRPCAGTVQQLRRHHWPAQESGDRTGSSESVRSDLRNQADQYSSTSSFEASESPLLAEGKVWERVTGSLAAVQLPAGKYWPPASEDDHGQPPPGTECAQVLSVQMTTCSDCPCCQCPVYDDDIMSGWSCDDSDLQSRCAYCGNRFSPRLSFQVFISASVATGGPPGTGPRPSTLLYKSETNYLSPFVLRKELESVLAQEGEVGLLSPSLLRDHSILYWNLVWGHARLGLPSQLLAFLTLWLRERGRALVASCQAQGPPHAEEAAAKYAVITELTGHEQVLVYLFWELNQLSGRTGMPLYRKYLTNMMAGGQAGTPQRNVLQQVVQALYESNMKRAIELLLRLRSLSRQDNLSPSPLPLVGSSRSVYRELMFLAIVALDHYGLNLDTFQRLYEQYWPLAAKEAPLLCLRQDEPPSEAAFHCRRLLRPLLLL